MTAAPRSVRSARHRLGLRFAALGALGLLAACTSSRTMSASTDHAGASSSGNSVPTISAGSEGASTTIGATPSPPPTLPPTVVTTAPAVPTTSPPSCPDTTAPSGAAVNIHTISGDWNGDGVVDHAVSWGVPVGGGAKWFVRTEITGGRNSTLALGSLGGEFAAVVGSVDVDFSTGAPPGTVRDEFLAIVGTNAAGYNLGVFGTKNSGCLLQFDNGGSDPYIIPVHGAAAVASGMMCDGTMGSRFIVRLEAETSDGTNWNTRNIKVERTGTHSLADGVVIEGTLVSGSPELDAYSRATCDGVELIGGGAAY
jgi:hypothetical protein